MTDATLVLYLLDESEAEWLEVPATVEGCQSRMTRVIQESYDYRPEGSVAIGERVMEHRKVDAWTREIVPTEFVVSRVERSEIVEGSEFGGVAIAYCVRQPPEEAATNTQTVANPVPASV